jgi:two-component system, chemotaxis family, chemotaxis protein CheY
MQRILVVDNDSAMLELLTMVLGHQGYLVDTASNGEDAFRRIEDHRPDLVLLDLQMPILDGLSFARILHERSILVKIVVISTFGMTSPAGASEIGAVGHLSKPFHLDDLLATVKQNLPSVDSAG